MNTDADFVLFINDDFTFKRLIISSVCFYLHGIYYFLDDIISSLYYFVFLYNITTVKYLWFPSLFEYKIQLLKKVVEKTQLGAYV